MHEQGLAIDFTWQGRVIAGRSSPAYVWLSRNAARFGLYNLPSEPWHWSTNGNEASPSLGPSADRSRLKFLRDYAAS